VAVFEKIISKTSPAVGDSSAGSKNPPAPAASSTSAASSNPTPARSAPSPGQRNVLLPDVEINGSVNFQDALIVDGKIEGEITSSDGALTIGEPAKIKAEIKTKSVVVYGKVHGNITASERVELKKDSEVLGDIKTTTLTMEAGATFVGSSTVGAAANSPASSPSPSNGGKKNDNGNKSGQHGQQGKLTNAS
jgi:cytoskeletal protein CcmA (bactofilin family)